MKEDVHITNDEFLTVADINLEILAIAFEIETLNETNETNADDVLDSAERLKDFVWGL